MLSAVMHVTLTQCCEEGFAPPLLIPYVFAYLSHLIVFQIIKYILILENNTPNKYAVFKLPFHLLTD